MSPPQINPFDRAAATWDDEPRRLETARAVAEAILRQVRPTRDMDALDYGCGTGLLGLLLLPHVRSVTAADGSPGMLKVLEEKIRSGGVERMRTQKLDLEREPVPVTRYHLIATGMVLHHIKRIDPVLAAFHKMLLPGGCLAVADLDAEPGLFHSPETAASVQHHGFDRDVLKDRLRRAGFENVATGTAHEIRKPTAGDEIRTFPVFWMVGYRV